jgi:hypothetical protein
MGELSTKILEEIKQKKIEPLPRWQCLAKNYVIWTSFGFAVVIGAVSFSVILEVLSDSDWDIVYKYATDNPLQRAMLAFPFFWFFSLAIFLALAYFNYKHTKCGYKHETYIILGLSVVISIILGAILHFTFRMGERIELSFAKSIPFYAAMNSHCNNREIWMQPEKGLLAGTILMIANKNHFDLEDFDGRPWEINEGDGIALRGKETLSEFEEVKIIGERESENSFHALEIRRWSRGCVPLKKRK